MNHITHNTQTRKKLQGNSYTGWCKCCIAACFVAIVFVTSSLQAAPITQPTSLSPGDKYRLVFTTSNTRNAASSNISDYNSFVTNTANTIPELVALGTTWSAIASTSSIHARDNTSTHPLLAGVPIYRLDDQRVANGNADFWDGSIIVPLSIDQSGGPAQSTFAWTGTTPAGVASSGGAGTSLVGFDPSCGGCIVGAPASGDPSSTSSAWVSSGALFFPGQARPFYALSGELTAVPEPSSFVLGIVGLMSLSFHGGQRRNSRQEANR